MKPEVGPCGAESCGCDKKSRMGAMTWIAMVGAVAVVGAALYFSVKDHRVAIRATNVGAAKPWYPEPAFLLQHADQLNLTTRERRHVEIASREWDLKKAAFDVRFKTYNKDCDDAISELNSNRMPGGEEGKLLSSFNAAREKAWSEATAPLNSDQVMALDRLRNSADKKLAAFFLGDTSSELSPGLTTLEQQNGFLAGIVVSDPHSGSMHVTPQNEDRNAQIASSKAHLQKLLKDKNANPNEIEDLIAKLNRLKVQQNNQRAWQKMSPNSLRVSRGLPTNPIPNRTWIAPDTPRARELPLAQKVSPMLIPLAQRHGPAKLITPNSSQH